MYSAYLGDYVEKLGIQVGSREMDYATGVVLEVSMLVLILFFHCENLKPLQSNVNRLNSS